MNKTQIFLDTSFVLDILKFKINLDTELLRICDFQYELVSFDLILKELENKKLGKLAKKFLEIKNVKLLETPNNLNTLDEVFLTLTNNPIIATNDGELKNLLKSKHIKTLTIRQKMYLIII